MKHLRKFNEDIYVDRELSDIINIARDSELFSDVEHQEFQVERGGMYHYHNICIRRDKHSDLNNARDIFKEIALRIYDLYGYLDARVDINSVDSDMFFTTLEEDDRLREIYDATKVNGIDGIMEIIDRGTFKIKEAKISYSDCIVFFIKNDVIMKNVNNISYV